MGKRRSIDPGAVNSPTTQAAQPQDHICRIDTFRQPHPLLYLLLRATFTHTGLGIWIALPVGKIVLLSSSMPKVTMV